MPRTDDHDPRSLVKEEFRLRDISSHIELACWAGLALVPLLRWINGPPVSAAQFVVQTTLTCLTAVGAIGLRFYNKR
jgi:hypothetical protein